MNCDINSKFNIIEKTSKNQSNSQIKPISRTMANIENINSFINNESTKDNSKNNKIPKLAKKNSNNNIINFKSKKSENLNTKNIIKKNTLKNAYNYSSSYINLITANTSNCKDSDNNYINQKNDINIDSKNNNINSVNPSFIISVNRNKNNKKLYLASPLSSKHKNSSENVNTFNKNLKTNSPLSNKNSISNKVYECSSTKNINYHQMIQHNSMQRNKSLISNNIDKDELRKKIKESLNSKKNKYKIKKKYIKAEGKESPYKSNNISYDKCKNNEINNNNNININNIINTTNQNKEKTKLQLFYSEHLNKYKNYKNSPKNLKEKKISNNDTLTKNSRSIINNYDYDSSIVDIGTNQDTIDNRKKKSFVCPTKNKKENNKQNIKNLANNEKKKK